MQTSFAWLIPDICPVDYGVHVRACRVLDSFLVRSVESGGVDGLYVAHQLKHPVS